MQPTSASAWYAPLFDRWWPEVDATYRAHAPSDGVLGRMMAEAWGAGGKRLRAMLPMALAEAAAAPPERVLAFAAACELLHNGTLVHDDLQDGDTLRRGEPAMWVRHGAAQAINVGSAMYVAALGLVDACDAPPAARDRARRRLQDGLYAVIDGQAREFVSEDRLHPTWETWHAIVERKTGALFGAVLAGTAELLDGAPGAPDTLARVGVLLGVLFQLQDDFLDAVEDKGRARRGSDIAEGKISGVVLAGLDRVDADGRARLLTIVTRPRPDTTDAEIDEALRILDECGAFRATAERLVALQAEIDATSAVLPDAVTVLIHTTASLFLAPVARHLPGPA
jgi:geranylgeranyl pyrophosphate synthase